VGAGSSGEQAGPLVRFGRAGGASTQMRGLLELGYLF